MTITTVDKTKINKYLKEHNVNELSYLDMCDTIGKRGKIKDIEFLEYFTECIIREFNKSVKISTNNVTKIISFIDFFLKKIKDNNEEIPEDNLDKIRNIKEFYEEYLTKNNLEIDQEFNENVINELLKTVNELYPSETQFESAAKYIIKIENLETELKKLKKELAEITKSYYNLEKSLNQKQNKIESINAENTDLENKIENKDKVITKLVEQTEKLKAKIFELENTIIKLKNENTDLSQHKEQWKTLSIEIEKLKVQIENANELKKEAEDLKVKKSKIESLIYQKLLYEKATIDDILDFVKQSGIATNKDEITELLKKVRKTINVGSSSFSLSPTYKIEAPRIIKNGHFSINIPKGCNYYDIMLVSDFHLENINDKVINGIDILNNYCVKNGISLILNLGDFYHGSSGKPLDYENAIYNYSIIEKTISSIPKDDGIYHAILGGNHDKSIIKYGYDPLKLLSEEREDFINLGYIHSSIILKGPNDIVGSFDLHHPHTFDFSIKLSNDGMDTSNLNKYLNEIYTKQCRSREDSYIDIFGHTHKSQFNYPDSYCFIPSYFENGACHLRIYIDDEKQIKYMIFFPLSLSNKLIKNNEIVYQKILSK